MKNTLNSILVRVFYFQVPAPLRPTGAKKGFPGPVTALETRPLSPQLPSCCQAIRGKRERGASLPSCHQAITGKRERGASLPSCHQAIAGKCERGASLPSCHQAIAGKRERGGLYPPATRPSRENVKEGVFNLLPPGHRGKT